MVAGPNGLDLKKIQMRVKFKICFKFGLKIKKKSPTPSVWRGGARFFQAVRWAVPASACMHGGRRGTSEMMRHRSALQMPSEQSSTEALGPAGPVF
jgi:hypothetical protein